jgi:hypothetical protein
MMAWWRVAVLAVASVFVSNVIAIAADLPWWARPLGVLHYVVVDLASRAFRFQGYWLADIVYELHRYIWPAVAETMRSLLEIVWFPAYWRDGFEEGATQRIPGTSVVTAWIGPVVLFCIGLCGVRATVLWEMSFEAASPPPDHTMDEPGTDAGTGVARRRRTATIKE